MRSMDSKNIQVRLEPPPARRWRRVCFFLKYTRGCQGFCGCLGRKALQNMEIRFIYFGRHKPEAGGFCLDLFSYTTPTPKSPRFQGDWLAMAIVCPKCGAPSIRKSHRRWFDFLLRSIGMVPLRCNVCNHRFFRFRRSLSS